MQHHINKAIRPHDHFESSDVCEIGQIHRLRENSIFGSRLRANRFPPEMFLFKFGDKSAGKALRDGSGMTAARS